MLIACDDAPHAAASAPRERSQAVVAAAEPARPAPAVTSAAPAASAARPKAPRAFCAGQSPESKGLPKKRVSQAHAANSATKLPENLSAQPGAFTWVNFWAAWCAPCKEEIPRLLRWERELTQKGRRFGVRFISLDDDERQLRQFLDSGQGLSSTYWLREGKERDEWMAAAALAADPELPIHLLVDASGHIRCRVQGAVEDADFAELEKLVR